MMRTRRTFHSGLLGGTVRSEAEASPAIDVFALDGLDSANPFPHGNHPFIAAWLAFRDQIVTGNI